MSDLVEVPGWNGQFLRGPRHTYWWKETPDSEPRPLSGITSVLGVIGKPNLITWAARMVTEHIKAAEGWVTDIGFGVVFDTVDQWKDFMEDAEKAHTKKKDAAAGLGTDAHALVEEYIKRCINENGGIPIPSGLAEPRVIEFADWCVQRNIETKFRFLASETPLADPENSIAGTPDFIAEEEVEGEMILVIGDLKTSSGIYDRTFFAQMAAYAYMLIKKQKRHKGEPRMVIMHMPSQKPNQVLATYWSDDYKGDWTAFRAALYLHRWKDNFASPYKKTKKV